MWRATVAATVVLALYATQPAAGEDASDGEMTQERMEAILRALGSDFEDLPGMLEFSFSGVRVECVYDVEHDRMRLIAPIRRVSELTPEQVASILEANFHTALDARYATSRGVLYAAYIHPLSPLSERQLQSAVRQVSNLARSFGSSYSSGVLVYGGGESL